MPNAVVLSSKLERRSFIASKASGVCRNAKTLNAIRRRELRSNRFVDRAFVDARQRARFGKRILQANGFTGGDFCFFEANGCVFDTDRLCCVSTAPMLFVVEFASDDVPFRLFDFC